MKPPLGVVRIGLALGATLWFGTPPTHAAEQGISVAQAYQSALRIDPDIQATEKRLEAANSATKAASALTPEPLALEGSYRSDQNFDNQGFREIELGVVAPVWHWGERQAAEDLAIAELELTKTEAELLKLELAAQVRQAYWATIAAHLDVEIAQARLVGSKRLLQDVEKRVAAGDMAPVDLRQAQALHAQTKADFGSAIFGVTLLAAEFTTLTGLEAEALSTPRIESGRAFDAQPAVFEHPAMRQALRQADVARLKASLLSIQRRPNPEVGLALVSDKGNRNAPEEKSLMINTRIPLGSSPKAESRHLGAQADALASQARVRKLENSLRAKAQAAGSVMKLFEDLKTSAEERATAQQEAFSMMQKSFDLGETDLPTLLRFEQQAHEAQRLARKATVEYAAKVSEYKQALGLLPEILP